MLAAIALKTGDYATAETYFRRVVAASPAGSFSNVEATIGLAVAMAAQLRDNRGFAEVRKLLLDLEKQVPSDADFETRLQLVRALQLASSYMMERPSNARRFAPYQRSSRLPVRTTRQDERSRSDREQLAARTATLLAELLKEQPDNLQAQLRRAELLLGTPSESVLKILVPNGESPRSVLESILASNPESDEAAFLYVRMAAAPATSQQSECDYARASSYAQALLADNPADSELIMLFLSVRDKYAMDLERQGKSQEAAQENERTLAVLSFLTERADFTPEMRERLVMLVAMRPEHDQGRSQQEQEIRTLLQNYDEARIKDLQQRMQRMRANPTSGRRRPSRIHGSRRGSSAL